MSGKLPTEALASYVVRERFDTIAQPAVEMAKQCFLDTLACSLGGSQTSIGRIFVGLASLMRSSGKSSILGTSMKTSSPVAAMVNSTLANALDYDDDLIGHLGATASAPALAAGEHLGVSGRELLTSIVVGYEVSARIGASIQPSANRFNQVWGLGTFQVFGAVAKLLKVDEKQTISAFGIAGSNAPVPSVRKTVLGSLGEVSMVKNNYAMATFAGVTAAFLARDGFVGRRDILDGDDGFWVMAGSDRCDFDRMVEGVGTRYEILNVSFKPYPTCRWLHSTLDAGLQIVEENGIKPDEIKHVYVRTPTYLTKKPHDTREPKDMIEAQFSLPYSLAVALSGVKPGPKWFAPEMLSNPAILELSRKIELGPGDEPDQVEVSDEVIESHGGVPSEVEVCVQNRSYTKKIRYPKGHPTNPVSLEERKLKFLNLTTPVLGSTKAQHVMHYVQRLERQSDIVRLSHLLQPPLKLAGGEKS